MEKIINDWTTKVKMTSDEAKNICNIGKGDKCCAFLVMGNGFECIRMSYPANSYIFSRLDAGTINAKGKGGWKDCAWEGEM